MTSPNLNSTSSEPEAYQIGWIPFLGATIYLDSHPLIPRTETEWWVEQCIKTIPTDRPVRVLDLFSGSGCVGVAVLLHTPNTHVTFAELVPAHCETIKKNIAANTIDQSRTTVVESNVWSAVSGTYDLILANPPYLAESRRARIEDSVLIHEPHAALFADKDGFALIEATIEGLPEHLSVGGHCWIEHEPEHATEIHESAQRLGLSTSTHQDQYRVERYSVILKP
ncbi:MAG: peptide chain release factor N(5)-glutamine methyltransferase [Candidatus Pacebacteria bacterium]|nr:peptide chain release factor N(5)-glutamine methyltransferase [Candidatus Paceibacterota bacterium]